MSPSIPRQEPEFSPRLVSVIAIFAVFVVTLSISGCMVGMPKYWVYQQRMEGEAMLAKAEYSKKVLVQDALAREESAQSLAKAAVIQAEGVAKANKIIGQSLENNPKYLQYLWIHNLEAGDHDVIYVPTEGNLPILEAGFRGKEPLNKRKEPGEPGTPEHTDVPMGESDPGATVGALNP